MPVAAAGGGLHRNVVVAFVGRWVLHRCDRSLSPLLPKEECGEENERWLKEEKRRRRRVIRSVGLPRGKGEGGKPHSPPPSSWCLKAPFPFPKRGSERRRKGGRKRSQPGAKKGRPTKWRGWKNCEGAFAGFARRNGPVRWFRLVCPSLRPAGLPPLPPRARQRARSGGG